MVESEIPDRSIGLSISDESAESTGYGSAKTVVPVVELVDGE